MMIYFCFTLFDGPSSYCDLHNYQEKNQLWFHVFLNMTFAAHCLHKFLHDKIINDLYITISGVFFHLACYSSYQNWMKLNPRYITQILILVNFWCFIATFSNISAISWRPLIVVEEAGVPVENHRPWASNWLTLSLATVRRVHPFCNLQSRARTHAVSVIGLYELLGNPTT